MAVGAGGTANANVVGSVACWPSGLVSTTVAFPTAWAGVTQVHCVVEPTLTPVAAVPPNVTAVVPESWNAVPVSVTVVPPAMGPMPGAPDDSVGGGTACHALPWFADWPSAFVSVTV